MQDSLSYRRNHSLLLLNRLLSSRPGSSPFTLLLDSLEQSSQPLVREYINRAKANKVIVVLLAFNIPTAPPGVETFIQGLGKDITTLQREIAEATNGREAKLLIIDTLHPLINRSTIEKLDAYSSSVSTIPSTYGPAPVPTLSGLLTSLASPTTSLLATFHTDVPLLPDSSNPYAPSPQTLLFYLATTIITTHSFPQTLARRRAAARALPPPLFGLAEGIEGVLVGLGANGGSDPATKDFIVLELEHRRKSGRGVSEWFVLPTLPYTSNAASNISTTATEKQLTRTTPPPAKAQLLDDHPLVREILAVERPADGKVTEDYASAASAAAAAAGTFSLSLTEKQKQDRAGVVLPYFDAQKDGGRQGPGEGGRILYQMGVEDLGDWDSEEDEL